MQEQRGTFAGKVGRYAAALASSTSSRALQVTFVDTDSSSRLTRTRGFTIEGFCDEYLGDIHLKQLSTMLFSLANTNNFKSSIPEIFGGAVFEIEQPLMVMADFEYTWEGDSKTTMPIGRRFVGLHIVSDHNE